MLAVGGCRSSGARDGDRTTILSDRLGHKHILCKERFNRWVAAENCIGRAREVQGLRLDESDWPRERSGRLRLDCEGASGFDAYRQSMHRRTTLCGSERD